MSIKKNWFKSLAVAAVVAMASANASADVVAAVTANGNYGWSEYGGPYPIAGMSTSTFKHSGGQLIATYSAECALDANGSGPSFVYVAIRVYDATGNYVTTLSPTAGTTPFCSSSGERGFNNWGSFAKTGVGTLPPGTYRVEVRGGINRGRGNALMGARSLVVSH